MRSPPCTAPPLPFPGRLKDSSGTETVFKVKKTTKFSRIVDAYCQRAGVAKESIRLVHDGAGCAAALLLLPAPPCVARYLGGLAAHHQSPPPPPPPHSRTQATAWSWKSAQPTAKWRMATVRQLRARSSCCAARLACSRRAFPPRVTCPLSSRFPFPVRAAIEVQLTQSGGGL